MAQIIRAPRIGGEAVLIRWRTPEPSSAPPSPASAPPESAAVAEPEAPQPEASPPRPEAAPPQPEAAPLVSLEEMRRQAAEEGYRDGYEAGSQAAMAERAQELEALRAFGGAARKALVRGVEGLEELMVEIAFAAVCKVLGEAALTVEGLRAMVREAMREVRSKESLVLRISPRDYEMLRGEGASARPLIDDARIEVVADERVTAGCLIETGGGTLDARLEVQMRQLLDTLARAREAASEQR